MKKFTVIFIYIMIIMVSYGYAANYNKHTKEEALVQIEKILKEATYHTGAIQKIAAYAMQANANYDIFVLYAEKAATVGYHTMMYVDLAKRTAKLNEEVPLLVHVANIVEVETMNWDTLNEMYQAAINANCKKMQIIRERH